MAAGSTTPTTPGRTTRGRVLALGVPAEVGLDRYLIEPSVEAESVFHAMSALASATADEPIGAVLVGATAEHEGDEGLRALRRIDPAVPVVLLAQGQMDAVSAADAFDDVLLPPLTAAGMTRAFERNVAIRDEPLPADPPTPRPVEDMNTGTATPVPVATSSAMGGEELATPSTDDLPSRGESASRIHPPVAQRQPASPLPTRSAGRLGDVDLVACVSRGDGTLADLAMQLIVQQTGWEDIALVDEPAEHRCPVRHGDEHFGHLQCAHASREQLEAWARWLGQWLSLERNHRRYRRLAFVDDLTGAWNRRYFMQYMNDLIRQARRRRMPVSIMVFDVDNFKHFNDTFGHEAGDEILIETVRLLHSVIRQSDKVCRIGGDEFVVVFADLSGPREDGSTHPAEVEAIARRFQEQICRMRFPKLGAEAPGPLSISAGLANFPWDGSDPSELLRIADQRALASKRAGKNAITFGPQEG